MGRNCHVAALIEVIRRQMLGRHCSFAGSGKQNNGRTGMETQKYAAEAIGTFWLPFTGCGSAVIAAAFPQVGIGLVGVSLAFGLSVVTMAYAIGHVSGGRGPPAGARGVGA